MDIRYEDEPAALNQKELLGDVKGEEVGNMWKGYWSGNFLFIFSACCTFGCVPRSAAKPIKNLLQLRRNRVNSSS